MITTVQYVEHDSVFMCEYNSSSMHHVMMIYYYLHICAGEERGGENDNFFRSSARERFFPKQNLLSKKS